MPRGLRDDGFPSITTEAVGDVLNYLELVLHVEVQFLEHLGLSPNRFGSRFVVKLVLPCSRLESLHSMVVKPDQL